ncbi:MAG: hypothetical protein HOD92_25920 [Deltaproteobacteria bacterium]|nr:hypothetical protein [Deltaproteobacteria bacterium]MBT4526507.1 hypothetical protein [Deltaproteobacteria bacterium]
MENEAREYQKIQHESLGYISRSITQDIRRLNNALSNNPIGNGAALPLNHWKF